MYVRIDVLFWGCLYVLNISAVLSLNLSTRKKRKIDDPRYHCTTKQNFVGLSISEK